MARRAAGGGTTRRATALVVVASAMLSACWWGGDDDDAVPADTTAPTTAPDEPVDEPVVTVAGVARGDERGIAGVSLRLSEGEPAGAPVERLDVVAGTPIAPADVDAIFDRLPPWDVPDTDVSEFERPAQTLPPPLVGDTVETTFPPAADGGEPDALPGGPLHVVRVQPEGDVDVAPFLTVTFDQPMVPLATLDQLEARSVPAVISPDVDGRWRWIGTRTLRFEVEPGPIDRLPAATEYEVTIPAGTTSQTGGSLEREVSFRFTTPPPSVTSFVGDDDSTGLTPVFVATFDQRVDPDAVLATVGLDAGGDDVAVRVASADEVDADDRARTAVEAALDGRAVAFRPVAALPPDTPFTVTIGPATPSDEGPLVTDAPVTFVGRTFGSLEVRDHNCRAARECEPGTPFTIEFSNALDPEAFDGSQVDVDPAIRGLNVNVAGSTIELRGRTDGRTTYTVTLDGSLADVFGQTLGDDVRLEFDVGAAPPTLLGLDRDWITIDPGAETAQVSVTTVNHESIRARAWAVTPVELTAFREYQQAQWSDEDAPEPDWPLVLDEVIPIDADPDVFAETAIDLSDAFARTGSQLVVRIDPTLDFGPNDDDYWRNRPTISWVQSTTLGVDAFFDNETLVIWATDLVSGQPLERVAVELIGDGRVATTNAEGLAELELGDDGVLGLWATSDDRTSFLPAQWYEGWRASEQYDEGRWYVFDDRGIYRPGETVRLTGWVRNFARSTDAQLALYDGDVDVRYRAWDPQGNELASGTAAVNALGGFNLSIDLPEGANLGQAWVDLEIVGAANGAQSTANHAFQIQEFRRPEFEVTTTNESPGPHFLADPATVRVDANFFAGGPLPGAEVDWLVSKRDTTYRPPNWDDYAFGVWIPWWDFGGDVGGASREIAVDIASEPCFDCGPVVPTEYEEFTGVTDAGGSHYLRIDATGDERDLPTTVTAEATVFDVNRQAWSARTDLLVHAAEQYVGLRSDRTFVREGTPIRIDAVVTDVDGGTVPGRQVTVTAGRLEWALANGEWAEQLVDEQTCAITSTGDPTDGSMRCEFATDVGGTYRITAVVVDDAGRRNRTELTQWVTGAAGRPLRGVEQGRVTIVPDRETYAPGDTAELLVQAPFSPAHGIVTVARGGIVSTEAFEADDGSAVIEIPIVEAYVPDVHVFVEVAGADQRRDDDGNPVPDVPDRPAFASGEIGLAIPPVTRSLDVVATPAATSVEPGASTSVTVDVTDADGNAVAGADVAVVVVDEAVLSLTGYELADPLDVFYGDVWTNLNREYMRSSVLLARSDLVTAGRDDLARANAGELAAPSSTVAADATEEAAEDSAGGATREGTTPIPVRTNFDALAVYAPSESTDAGGRVTVDVPLPDSLTRYRVMAVAVDGADRFGKGESTITARLPLQVRPSAPRFLNFGDQFELPVVVQNQTDAPIEVDVALQVANLKLTGPVGQTVTVPPNDRVEVRFPATTDNVGTARFRVAAVSGEMVDAAADDLPVYTPATAEAFATYGVVDDGAIAQPATAPVDVWPQFGGLEINTSSTALQALTDAVLYLVDYPYESADSLASRIMAIATLRDVLDAFDAEGLPSTDELNAAVRRDVASLVDLQNDDGGFPYWQRGRRSIPWVSIQTTHALVLARQAGYDVPGDALDRALAHLAEIEEHFEPGYDEQIRNTLSSYALAVRAESGQRDVAKATDLYTRAGDDLELDAVAWLWPSIIDEELRAEITTRISNSAVETAGAATFATRYGEDAYVIAQSDRKTDGIILQALISQAPDSDLIPKVVAGLLGGQTRGRWNNAHENAFILMALDRYFDTFEAVDPSFVARAWLGDLYVAEVPFDGRSTDRVHTLVPMTQVISSGDATIVLAKEGDGRLYYRLGLRYAPSDLELDPRDEGFVVARTYEAVDDPEDVRRNADGSWTIAAGARVRVTTTMVADARRTHVALIDPLPAGLEPLNPAIATSQTTPPEDDGDADGGGDVLGDASEAAWFPWWNWYEHQNLRDDRAESFASVLEAGTYEYSYVARATTPGTFVVPPARAEEIYAPEVFGRSSTDLVVVE